MKIELHIAGRVAALWVALVVSAGCLSGPETQEEDGDPWDWEEGQGAPEEEGAGEAELCEEQSCPEEVGFLWSGEALPEEAEEVLPFLEGACEEGRGHGCYLAGTEYVLERRGGRDLERARALYARGCELGIAASCQAQGWMLYHGQGGEADWQEANLIWRRGCELGNGGACRQLGGLYYYGRGVDARPELAATYFYRGCLAADGAACEELESYFALDPGRDHRGIARRVEVACEEGAEAACVVLGALYEEGQGRSTQKSRAMRLYEESCEQGEVFGCTLEGMLRQRGGGSVSRRGWEARERFSQACAADERVACNSLAVMYLRGQGGEASAEKAVDYFKASCERGHGRGCFNLGLMYEGGESIEADGELAYRYHRIGCEQGYGPSCNSLAFMYEEGMGTEVDVAQQLESFEASCDRGYGKGCFNLGRAYDLGEEVEADREKAIEYYGRACDAGYGRGCNNGGVRALEAATTGAEVRAAVELLERACDGGERPRSCGRAGEALVDDPRIPESPLRARQLLESGCQANDGRSCLWLGYLYEQGRGVEEDEEEARRHYGRACTLDEAHGCGRRGWLMEDDEERAEEGRRLLEQGCGMGDDWACDRL